MEFNFYLNRWYYSTRPPIYTCHTMHTHIHCMYMYMYECKCMCVRSIHVRVDCMYIIPTYVHVCVHVHTYARTCTYMHPYSTLNTNTCIYTQTYTLITCTPTAEVVSETGEGIYSLQLPPKTSSHCQLLLSPNDVSVICTIVLHTYMYICTYIYMYVCI